MITINGVSYKGNNVSVSNGEVTIDGRKQPSRKTQSLTIEIHGGIEVLTVDHCDSLKVLGSAGEVQTQSGNVSVGNDVYGNVKTMSGNVKCGKVGGKIKTMSGNVKHL